VNETPTYASAQALGQHLRQRGWTLCTAESCTGGGVAVALTDVPGSSDWFDRAYVTYSNEAKTELLGVPDTLINQFGAVSAEVAAAMARAACQQARTMVSVSTTGIAGPGGATPGKPVGTVWFAWSVAGHVTTEYRVFPGDRAAVRRAAVAFAVEGLQKYVQR
jgi:nicotinamide-nucleotide amidase